MAKDLYIRNRRESHFSFRPILITTLVIALVIVSVALVIIAQRQRTADTALEDFNAAIASQSFQVAIEIYREVQASSIEATDESNQANLYRDVLFAMEAQIDQRLQGIETRLNNGQTLNDEDLAFASGMGEVSGLRLSRYARDLCRLYLTGQQDLQTVGQALDQLIRMENLKESVAPLKNQLPELEAAYPSVIVAEQLLSDQKWLDAHTAWLTLAEQPSTGTFVQDYARQRLNNARSAMYQPLLSIALDYLDQQRAVTARDRLKELELIFPHDRQIQQALETCDQLIPSKLVTYRGAVEHLAIKPLIVKPAIAFDQDIYARAAYDTMLTTTEFTRILEQLFANDFILIDQSKLMTSAGENFGIDLPEGKKPVVLVLEGFNYYVSRRATGNCWNLVLDEQGRVAGLHPGQDGNSVISRQAEVIGILDVFVEQHPGFSFDGAKGIITLTGYEGVFGYVTDQDQLDDRNQALLGNGYAAVQPDAAELAANREQAAAVIAQLKRTGWQFGSSTYGFINVSGASIDLVRDDWNKWQTQVGVLTGPVQVLQYPNGALVQTSDERSLFYQTQGIRIFGGLGATPYISRHGDQVYVDKVQLSGFSLANPQMYQLDRLFDAEKVIDRQARGLTVE